MFFCYAYVVVQPSVMYVTVTHYGKLCICNIRSQIAQSGLQLMLNVDVEYQSLYIHHDMISTLKITDTESKTSAA